MSLSLTSSDINFLLQRTGLSIDKLGKLLEEDENLLLESVSTMPSTAELLTISFSLFVKLSILKVQESKKFSYDEQDYIAYSVAKVYPSIYKESHYLIDKKKVGEKEAQQYLVLTGLFPEFLSRLTNKWGAPDVEFYIHQAEVGFKNAKKWEIADHVPAWVSILQTVKVQHWTCQ